MTERIKRYFMCNDIHVLVDNYMDIIYIIYILSSNSMAMTSLDILHTREV